jgi:hypothetical protein
VARTNAIPICGNDGGEGRVKKPSVLQAEDLASRGFCRGREVERDVIRSGTTGGGESGVWKGQAPFRVN